MVGCQPVREEQCHPDRSKYTTINIRWGLWVIPLGTMVAMVIRELGRRRDVLMDRKGIILRLGVASRNRSTSTLRLNNSHIRSHSSSLGLSGILWIAIR
jgi:hypothetical protein